MYLWIKAFHVIAVIAWMAGMLYLPRLFVYHADAPKGSPQSETFKVMEWRLLKFIINPAMGATWLLGLTMIYLMGWEAFRQSGWLHAKLVLVIVMSALHGFLTTRLKEFARDANTRSAKFYRVVNEIPALLIVLIVILVVVKPF
jgi:putative membrane protein